MRCPTSLEQSTGDVLQRLRMYLTSVDSRGSGITAAGVTLLLRILDDYLAESESRHSYKDIE